MANKVCPKCGEEYSDTYRKCPFCEEEAAITKGKRLRRGGKRSVKRQRKGGGALGIMLLLAVIIIAGVLSYIFFGDQIAGFMGVSLASVKRYIAAARDALQKDLFQTTRP